MRRIIHTALLLLIAPVLMFGTGLPDFGGISVDNQLTTSDADLSIAATSSGWSDLCGDAIANGIRNPVEYDFDSYGVNVALSPLPFDRDTIGTADTGTNSDRSDNVAGVTAFVLLIGALRLYLTSPKFRKILFDTFSPLSPLGYS